MAQTLTEHVPDLPETAQNFRNWTFIEAEEDTGLAIIYWGEDGG